MINPGKIHRAKGEIVKITDFGFEVQITRGSRRTVVKGWDCPKSLRVGDVVKVQVSFSITCDEYRIKTVRRAPARFQKNKGLQALDGSRLISSRSTAKLELVS